MLLILSEVDYLMVAYGIFLTPITPDLLPAAVSQRACLLIIGFNILFSPKCNLIDKEHFNKIELIPDSARWALLSRYSSLLHRGNTTIFTIVADSTSDLVGTANYIRSRNWGCRWVRVQSVALHSTNRHTGRHILSSEKYFFLYIKR